MDWTFLSFLSEPWFVLPWYLVGVLGSLFVIYDVSRKNTPLKTAMRWSWPIIVLFFSVIGLALYFTTARAPGIGAKEADEAKRAHHEYERNMFRRVNGAVIHCIAGDGLGIMTGMVIARAVGMTFWQEFWFEYAVGFLFGWLIFQYRSMTMMTDSTVGALGLAFRAEFFSMLTVMSGMGAVMGYITPLAATAQPKPLTLAFWGFGMLGLLLGYVITFPMNWLMVKMGWKHGMGGMEEAPELRGRTARLGTVGAMVALGAAALSVPAWLAEIRQGTPIGPRATLAASDGAGGEVRRSSTAVLGGGLQGTIEVALRRFEQNRGSSAMHAIDAALRTAEVGHAVAPMSDFGEALRDIRRTRHELHMGRRSAARRTLARAADVLRGLEVREGRAPAGLDRYRGATVLDVHGVEIGEVTGVEGQRLKLAVGGARDVWGFWDLSYDRSITVPAESLVFGPSRTIGSSLVVWPGV